MALVPQMNRSLLSSGWHSSYCHFGVRKICWNVLSFRRRRNLFGFSSKQCLLPCLVQS